MAVNINPSTLNEFQHTTITEAFVGAGMMDSPTLIQAADGHRAASAGAAEQLVKKYLLPFVVAEVYNHGLLFLACGHHGTIKCS